MLKLRRNARIKRHAGKAYACAVRAKPIIHKIDGVIDLIPKRNVVVSPVPDFIRADLNQRLEHLIAGEELIAEDGDEGGHGSRFHIALP